MAAPKYGVSVTVYGIPWNAMLMFGAEAGPVRNKAELKKLFSLVSQHRSAHVKKGPERTHAAQQITACYSSLMKSGRPVMPD